MDSISEWPNMVNSEFKVRLVMELVGFSVIILVIEALQQAFQGLC